MSVDGRIDERTGFSVTWTLDEPMARASHALAADGRVWLVDPVDWAPALERVAALGEPAGVLQLLDRHNRDAAAIAARLGVPHLKLPATLPDTPFSTISLVDRPWWRESALWWTERRLLLVPEAIGTAPYFTLDHGAAGVHPMLRAVPPSKLRGLAPDHLLVGHGPPLHEGAAEALATALDRSRSDLPRLLTRLPALVKAARS
jgi:hypothetical protein